MPKVPARDGRMRKAAPGIRVADSAREALQLAFGENFRWARTKAGLTQHDIEAHTGIKQAYVSQVESGRINLTLATMTTFALAVGKDVRALLKQPASPAGQK
jgi:ribosome-binding protein aMBF1 (putative translation factor)